MDGRLGGGGGALLFPGGCGVVVWATGGGGGGFTDGLDIDGRPIVAYLTRFTSGGLFGNVGGPFRIVAECVVFGGAEASFTCGNDLTCGVFVAGGLGANLGFVGGAGAGLLV